MYSRRPDCKWAHVGLYCSQHVKMLCTTDHVRIQVQEGKCQPLKEFALVLCWWSSQTNAGRRGNYRRINVNGYFESLDVNSIYNMHISTTHVRCRSEWHSLMSFELHHALRIKISLPLCSAVITCACTKPRAMDITINLVPLHAPSAGYRMRSNMTGIPTMRGRLWGGKPDGVWAFKNSSLYNTGSLSSSTVNGI